MRKIQKKNHKISEESKNILNKVGWNWFWHLDWKVGLSYVSLGSKGFASLGYRGFCQFLTIEGIDRDFYILTVLNDQFLRQYL